MRKEISIKDLFYSHIVDTAGHHKESRKNNYLSCKWLNTKEVYAPSIQYTVENRICLFSNDILGLQITFMM